MALSIPLYSRLSPRHRQFVHMLAGGLGMLGLVLAVSALIGGPDGIKGPPKDLPKPRALGSLPGQALDPRDAWMGGAGKDLARLKDELKQKGEEIAQLKGALAQTREQMASQLSALQSRVGGGTPARVAVAASSPADSLSALASASAPAAASRQAAPAPAPMAFPSQRTLAPAGYPPGTPLGVAAPPATVPAAPAGAAPAMLEAPPALIRLSLGTPGGRGAAGVEAQTGTRRQGPRRTATFLPVSHMPAMLLGGLAAPTGGQAQRDPVPVLLRLTDLASLPNGFRAQVKGCLMVGEGYGDHAAERAYIRAVLLSCVLHGGRVLEVPVRASVFSGEDGMNGLRGQLVTKQGAILGNALLSGIAAGLGSGIASATQQVTSTSLGSVTATPTDAAGLLRMGLGTGVSKALDRLAQYYIQLAERTFPVVEIQAGRIVDVVLQQGVALDVALAAAPGAAEALPRARGDAPDNDRSDLLRTVADGDDDE